MARHREIGYMPFRGQGDAFWQSWLGGLVLRPWYDKVALPALARFYFPLSRAWAEALDETAEPRSRREGGLIGRGSDKQLQSAVMSARAKWKHYKNIEQLWEATLFAGEPVKKKELKSIQKQRKRSAFSVMNARSGFVAQHLREPFLPAALEIQSYDKVRKVHGDRLSGAAPVFPMPDELPLIEHSQAMKGKNLRKSWIRGTSPMGDTFWARVSEPKDREPIGTLVLCHGVGMEDEFWGSRVPKIVGAQGIRLISPEGPWHGRRRATGYYGGEPVLCRGTGGLLDYFYTHVREVGMITRWARETYGGAVAAGGISLGALTTQVVATAAKDWAEPYRPDAFFLITPSPSIKAVAFEGRLTRSMGLTEAVLAQGWTPETVADWGPLMEPQGQPCVDPDHIVIMVGEADEVTPAHTGKAFIRYWKVPEENAFIRPQGHFTTALGILRDPTPLARLAEILRQAG